MGNSTAQFYVAYLPAPMALWIASYNEAHPGPYGQFTGYIKAYTKVSSPVSVPSTSTDTSGNYIKNAAEW